MSTLINRLKKPVTKLESMDIEENSGVTDPAHLHSGWMVMKQADLDVADTDLQSVFEEIKKAAELMQALQAADYLEQAPIEVRHAVLILVRYLQSLEQDAAEAEDSGAGDIQLSAEDLTKQVELNLELLTQAQESLTEEAANEDSEDEILKHRGRSARRKLYKIEEAARTFRELYEALSGTHEHDQEVIEVAEETITEETVTKSEEVEEVKEEVVVAPVTVDNDAIAKAVTEAVVTALDEKINAVKAEVTTSTESVTKATDDLAVKLTELETRIGDIESTPHIKKSLGGQDEDVEPVKKETGWGLFPGRR